MRTVTSGAATQIARKLGYEPYVIVSVAWSSGIRYYSSKAMTITTTPIEERLLNGVAVSNTLRQHNVGAIGTVNVELDDSDGALKALIDSDPLELKVVTVYEWFQGLAFSDLAILFKGVAVGPIVWSDRLRKLSFEVETKMDDAEIGFSADPFSYPLLNPQAVNVAWPLCFGSVVMVPCLKLTTSPVGHLKYSFRGPLTPAQRNPIDPWLNDIQFQLQDGEGVDAQGNVLFPQETPVEVMIDGVIFSGHFEGDVFKVADNNLAKYVNVLFGDRDATDVESQYPNVAWLATPLSIVNNYIRIVDFNRNDLFLRVVRQEGTKIWFHDKATFPTNPPTLNDDGTFSPTPGPSNFCLFKSGDKIAEVAKNGCVGWSVTAHRPETVLGYSGEEVPGGAQIVDVISQVSWKFKAGTEVTLWRDLSKVNPDSPHYDVYVANTIPSTEVLAVVGTRKGKREPIPAAYYSTNLDDTLTFNNFDGSKTLHPTTLTFQTSLRDYNGQGWNDQIYAVLKSTIGPNTADIIQWVYETYQITNPLPVDSASFSAVHSLINNYPSHFWVAERRNLVAFCDEVAWQARCGLLVDSGSLKIRYLSKQPTADLSFNASNVMFTPSDTLSLSYTKTEDLVTSWVVEYRTTGYPDKIFDFRLFYKANINKFGLKKKVTRFFIYNIGSLVQKSVNFWGPRQANSWRIATLVSKLEAIQLEVFDTVALSTPSISSALSVVQKADYDTSNDQARLELWLPSVAGTTVQSPLAWLDDSSDTMPADPVDAWNLVVKDIQEPDFESKLRVFQQAAAQNTLPAVITDTVASTGGDGWPNVPANVDSKDGTDVFTVSVFANGYNNKPTKTGVTAAGMDPANPPEVGDRVAILNAQDKSYIISSPAQGMKVAKIKGGTNPYTWKEVDMTDPLSPVEKGDLKSGLYEMNQTTIINAGTYVWTGKQDGKDLIFFPLGGCPSS